MNVITELLEADEDSAGQLPNYWRAEECLKRAAVLAWNDDAKPELLSAAQTFALLAVCDRLYYAALRR